LKKERCIFDVLLFVILQLEGDNTLD